MLIENGINLKCDKSAPLLFLTKKEKHQPTQLIVN